VNDEEIIDWIRQVKAIVPDHAAFLDLMAATGLRFEEAINSWNLIIRLGENRLGEYYKSETLEHFRFKELFIRRTKKAFISFVPIGLIKRIVKAHPLTRSMIVKKIQRRGLRLRFGDIREYHASYLTKYLRPPEIDFLYGRISTGVFMRNYFNPAWIKDLKERTLRGSRGDPQENRDLKWLFDNSSVFYDPSMLSEDFNNLWYAERISDVFAVMLLAEVTPWLVSEIDVHDGLSASVDYGHVILVDVEVLKSWTVFIDHFSDGSGDE